jgi:hypothetical protein
MFLIAFACKQSPQPKAELALVDLPEMQALKERIEQKEPEAIELYNKLINDANEAMKQGPFSVMLKKTTPPSGDKHDYLSLGPYWWPDPDKPDGLPYIRKDGEVNPETRDDYTDYRAMKQCFNAISTLGKAYYYTENADHAQKAESLIKAWFLNAGTKMNPNLNFGQGVPGRNTGRPYGIIEFNNIGDVIITLEILKMKHALPVDTENGMKLWLTDYADWLQSSELGIQESTRKNNHATWYDVQLCQILLYTGDKEKVQAILEDVKLKRIATQIEPDGSQPHELARTKSFSYSTMNLSGFTKLAEIGLKTGVELWNYETEDGRSIKKAYEFLIPYITSDKEWEYQQLAQTGDYKARFKRLVAHAGKTFNDEYLLKVAEESNTEF